MFQSPSIRIISPHNQDPVTICQDRVTTRIVAGKMTNSRAEMRRGARSMPRELNTHNNETAIDCGIANFRRILLVYLRKWVLWAWSIAKTLE